MKKIIVLFILICFIPVSCVKSPTGDLQAAKLPARTQKFIGRLNELVSMNRLYGDKLTLQKEKEQSLEVYSVDMSQGVLSYEYSIEPQEELLFSKQLDEGKKVVVRQLGNGEENNVLVLEGKSRKTLASKIAYSENALVSTSPSENYIIYCAADDIVNKYSLYLYNVKADKTILLIDTANEELLNDMDWNISWSPKEDYLVISNQLVFSAGEGKLISEINSNGVTWSDSGNKLAYIKPENGYGKAVCVLNLDDAEIKEVFIANEGEYLSGYMVWNKNGSKLAFATSDIAEAQAQDGIGAYIAAYSLDLESKDAVRLDTALGLANAQVMQLTCIQYNGSGDLIGLIIANSLGNDLYLYNLKTKEWDFYLNIEYLHYEGNEGYVCSAGDRMYFIQGQSLIEAAADMSSRLIYKSFETLDDFYITKDAGSMIIVEKTAEGTILRQLANFADGSM